MTKRINDCSSCDPSICSWLPVQPASVDSHSSPSQHQKMNIDLRALCAVADLLSKEVDAPKVDGMKYTGLWHSHDYLNAIAAELESQ